MLFRINPNGSEANKQLITKMNNMTIKTFLVEGMTCKNCKTYIENSIKTIVGVDDVIADVTNGQVRISGYEINIVKVKELVEESGYHFKGEINVHTARNSDVWLG